MIQTSEVPFVDAPETNIIDFESAANNITTDRIAAALLHIASSESVRVLEALASAIVNALNAKTEVRHSFVFGRTRLLRYPNTIAADQTPKTAAFKRIARRALSRTLNDPTLGATAFHRIETSPDWSAKRLPVAVFGSFLFYRV